MQRLNWKLLSAITIDAIQDGWTYTITQQPKKWLLCVQPIQDRGPDWRKWFETVYLQDAMAIAQALAAGADLARHF
jgi:hypothetical protein